MICEFCNRTVTRTTKKIRKNFSKEWRQETIDACYDCHKTFHKFCSEMQLATIYNTLELLNTHEDLLKYKIWIRKQREGVV